MKWQDKLTKKELKHTREWVGNTLVSIKNQVAKHEKMRKEDKGYEPCFICKTIAGKLGLR